MLPTKPLEETGEKAKKIERQLMQYIGWMGKIAKKKLHILHWRFFFVISYGGKNFEEHFSRTPRS